MIKNNFCQRFIQKVIFALLTITIISVPFLSINIPKVYACYTWAVGNRVGLKGGAEIRTGSGLGYPVHTIVPNDNWQVDIIDGPRYADGEEWWDISRENLDGGGTGWVYISQAGYDLCGNEPGRLELVDDLSLRSDGSGVWPPQVGDKLIAHIKVRNAGDQSLHVQHIGVRGRRNGSENWDIGWWTIDLDGGQEWSLDPNNERPLQEGSYSFRISYSLDGSNWTEIGNEINFTVQSQEPGRLELVDDLSLRSDGSGAWPPQVGDKLIAHIKVRNAGDQSLHVEHIGVRGRRNGSENWDIGWWTIDLNGGQEWSLDPNNERPLQEGSYSFRISYSLDGSNWTEIGNEINFTVSSSTYSVSGHVQDDNGDSLSGVTISDGAGHSDTTDSNGNYTLIGLTADTYNIAPSKSSYTFSPSSHSVTVPPNASGQDFVGNLVSGVKAWTLMFYFAADNNLDSVMTHEYTRLREASNNSNVNIIAFWDGIVSDARYDVFFPGGGDRIPKGEQNTGDPTTLEQFVTWSMQAYPANHYALIIADHGHGVTGVAFDDSSSGDYLSPNEIKDALSTVAELDIIYMHACLMATIESGYQLRDTTDYYVASESIGWAPIEPDRFVQGYQTSEHIIPAVTGNTTPQELALAMAQNYVLRHANHATPSTVSVARLADASDVASKASALASLLRQMPNFKSVLDNIRPDVQHFEENGDDEITGADGLVDLYHFAHLVESRVSDSNVQNAAQQLKTAIENYVIFNDAWSGSVNGHYWSHNNSYGVSVFFPPPNQRQSFYSGDWLDFATGANWNNRSQSTNQITQSADDTIEWGPMLVDYVLQTDPDASDNPNPPDLLAPLIAPSTVYLPLVMHNYIPSESDCIPGANGVVLYEHPNYQGRCITFTEDDNDFNNDSFNDIASSIRFVGSYASGWEAVMYEHTYYMGQMVIFQRDDPDFGNDVIGHDQASSIRIRQNTCSNQYYAEYYNNQYLSGSPTFTQCEDWPISYDWGDGGPGNGVGNDSFSVRWTGRFYIATGTYTFTARSDDGIRVWFDGELIIDAWHDQATTEYQATRSVNSGEHDIKVEYYENGGGAVAQFQWEQIESACPGQYHAEYYDNRYLDGNSTFTQCEDLPINYDWGEGGPGNGVGNDNFSVRWTSRLYIAAGIYTFIARSDDGIKVWLDGDLIIDAWQDQAPTEYQTTRSVSSGEHDIRVEYYEYGGGAVAQFQWE
jgi:hypothetical protein